MNTEKHLTLLGILHITFGGLFTLMAAVSLAILAGIGMATGQATGFAILGIVGMVGFLFFLALGLPGIIGGIGLMKRRSWARYLIIGLSCLNLFAFPVGTGLAIYAFIILMDDKVIAVFQGNPPVVSPPVPQ